MAEGGARRPPPDPTAPHETMIVLDGSPPNAVAQALQFHEAVGLTGITMTSWMPGAAVLLVLAERLDAIRYVGVGEQAEDMDVHAATSPPH